MSDPARPVDLAMAEDRAPKRVIRGLWIERVVELAPEHDPEAGPLYLTLCGALGREIEMLIERGVIRRAENGEAIEEADVSKVIAVESSPEAVLALQRRFPGLRIVEKSVRDMVRSENPMAWPETRAEDRHMTRARVINLDLDEPLLVSEVQAVPRFPILTVISKMAQIHADRPDDWVLCLTLHGQIYWTASVALSIQRFLLDNFDLEEAFRESARAHLGQELFDLVNGETAIEWEPRNIIEHQLMLMLVVPKTIAHLVASQGWRITSARCLRYGGTQSRAPMVSWILDFTWDTRGGMQGTTVYRESLRVTPGTTQYIDETGAIQTV